MSAARAASLVLVAFALGACTARDGGSGLIESATGTTVKPQYTPGDFAKTTYCPPIEIRSGTEAMTVYERGHDEEPAFVRYQASIGQTARECQLVGTTLTMKVGVAGRVLAGPKGGAGNLTIPIRVAVVKQTGGSGPLYSQLFKVPVTLSPPTLGANYNQVFDQVVVEVGPEDRNLIIYVGFDEGPKT
jgi:hypothetical protein